MAGVDSVADTLLIAGALVLILNLAASLAAGKRGPSMAVCLVIMNWLTIPRCAVYACTACTWLGFC